MLPLEPIEEEEEAENDLDGEDDDATVEDADEVEEDLCTEEHVYICG